MGFRKTSQARIFVDETIPSFLKARPMDPVSSQQGSRMLNSSAKPVRQEGSSAAPTVTPMPAPLRMTLAEPKISHAQALEAQAAPNAAASSKPHIRVDRRQKPLQLRAIFVTKAVVLALVVNIALYLVLQYNLLPQTLAVKGTLSRPAMHSEAQYPSHDSLPIISYRAQDKGVQVSPQIP